MSFQTFWGNITSKFTETIKEELAAQLQAIPNRPSFLGEIKLLTLDFGKVPPEIELTDLVDPFPEFYRFDDTEHLPGNYSTHYSQGGHPFSPGHGHLHDIGEEHSSITNVDQYEEHYPLSPTTMPQHAINPNELASSLRNLASNPEGPTNQSWEENLDVDSDQNSDELASGAYFGRDNLYYSRNFMNSYPPSPPSLHNHGHQNLHSKHDEDVQAHLKVLYDGDMSLTISTSLNIDYPTKNFMSLPIVLKVTGFTLEGTLVFCLEGLRLICR
ncbi:Mitochondrial distribution and morphology protein 12, variant 3 [Entomophthora muscae]|uniref:Mitochondrial distribution and morphology protein 12, variant 3 n=1 Tax=Entomophthora muscae TaxID=34485 RepID=A0ACC2S9C8_9FUNG|nr:Mitochondrial distribution and morphology protein 12, variant 3 [Entomophthora muscae]